MCYENDYCCIALAHDYGGVISGLVVVKSDGDKIFNLPHFNLKLEDLIKTNGTGYEIKVKEQTAVIPPKIINRFVAEVQRDILVHRQECRKKRKNPRK